MNLICVHTDDKNYKIQSVAEPLPQVSAEINEKTILNPNALGGRIWEGPDIFWKCESHYKWLTDAQIQDLIEAAFLESSLRTPLRIRRKNRKMSDAQIVINWLSKKDDSRLTSNSTLAYAWGPAQGLGGNCVMNADVLWLLRTTPLYAEEAKALGYIDNFADPRNRIRYYDPLHTIKHEVGGHSLGMRHLEEQKYAQTEIMYPFYNGLRKFGAADTKYLQDLYGKASVNKIILDILITRIQNLFRN